MAANLELNIPMYINQITLQKNSKIFWLIKEISQNQVMEKSQSKQYLKLTLRQQIVNLLNLEYKTKRFHQKMTFMDMFQQTVLALKQKIEELKYQLNSQIILKYAIKLSPSNIQPFETHDLKLVLQIIDICQILVFKKDYSTINNSLSKLNNLLHKDCVHNSVQEHLQKAHTFQSKSTHVVQQQKLHQKEINLFEKEQIYNEKMRLNLNKYYCLFSLNFRYLNLKEAIVFQTLSRCQIWFTICRQRRKSGKPFYLDPLIHTFDCIVKKINFLGTPFHVDVLPKKNIRNIQKKKNIQKSNNPLFEAVSNKNYNQVKKLILNGADIEAMALVNDRMARQMKCSHKAAANNDIQMCKILTSFGVNWQSEDNEKMTPIFYTIQSRSFEVLKYLVEEIKVNIQKQQIQNRTPFYWACTQGELEYIKYLYSKGANINKKSKLGRSPLSKACFLGRKDIAQFLLNCKEINMYSQDEKGRSPLHNATFGPKGGRQGQKFGTNDKDSPECAQLLLQRGFQVDFTDKEQNTSLHIAMSSQALDSIRLLMAYGASLQKINDYGETPIMTGAKFGHIQSVKLLYEQYDSPIIHKDIFNKNILLLVAKFRQFNDQKGKTTSMNPVYAYIIDKLIYQLYGKYVGMKSPIQKNKIYQSKQLQEKAYQIQTQLQIKKGLQELHYTFREMLYNSVHQEFVLFVKKCFQFNVPLPNLKLADVEYILNMQSLLQDKKQRQLFIKILSSKNQNGFHVFQLQQQKIQNFVSWIILKNNLKLLQFVQENKFLIFYHFNKAKHLEEIDADYDLPMELIVPHIPTLKQKVVTFCLLQLNFNWCNYIQKNTGGNILHLLIKSRKVGCLIQILKFLGGKNMAFVKNKYLMYLVQQQKKFHKFHKNENMFQDSPLHDILNKLMSREDESLLQPYKLAQIMKESSIIKILEQRLKQNSLNIDSKWEVREYQIEQQKQNEEQIKIFEAGFELQNELQQLINKINSVQCRSQLQKIFPIIASDPKMISQKIDIDNSHQQWNNMKTRPFYLIQKIEEIQLMKELLNQPIIGLDVQYDFTQKAVIMCTFQISSLSADYIVDMMTCSFTNNYKNFVKKLKDQIIKPIAYNQKILKLMHGSDHDLYIIKNSSRIDVDFTKKNSIRGLATLAKQYLNISMSKDHQVSEWRIRPIPYAMLDYARRDSMIMPFLVRKMLCKFENLQDLKQTLINGLKHAKKNKKQNQPLIKNLIPI